MPMTFADVREAGEAGLLGLKSWVRVRGCLDFAVVAYGMPLAGIDADPEAFDGRWAKVDASCTDGPFQSVAQFKVWRGNVLMALEAHAGRRAASTRAVEERKSDWRRLQDLLLLHGSIQQRNAIAVLGARARETGRSLAAVDRDWAVATQHTLTGTRRGSFRAGVATLDSLHAIPEIAASGLLPETVGSLPKQANLRKPRPLPAPLQQMFDRFVAAHPGMDEARRLAARTALGWAWKHADTLRILRPDSDPLSLATPAALRILRDSSRNQQDDSPRMPATYGPLLKAIFSCREPNVVLPAVR